MVWKCPVCNAELNFDSLGTTADLDADTHSGVLGCCGCGVDLFVTLCDDGSVVSVEKYWADEVA
jgi:transcription elongation factor Elf1